MWLTYYMVDPLVPSTPWISGFATVNLCARCWMVSTETRHEVGWLKAGSRPTVGHNHPKVEIVGSSPTPVPNVLLYAILEWL